jgi:hypothetical protein
MVKKLHIIIRLKDCLFKIEFILFLTFITDTELVKLQEDITLAGFTPLVKYTPEPVYCSCDIDLDFAQVSFSFSTSKCIQFSSTKSPFSNSSEKNVNFSIKCHKLLHKSPNAVLLHNRFIRGHFMI